MSRTRNPFSATPDLDSSDAAVPIEDRRGVVTPVECRCGREHTSAREALDCNHEHTHE